VARARRHNQRESDHDEPPQEAPDAQKRWALLGVNAIILAALVGTGVWLFGGPSVEIDPAIATHLPQDGEAADAMRELWHDDPEVRDAARKTLALHNGGEARAFYLRTLAAPFPDTRRYAMQQLADEPIADSELRYVLPLLDSTSTELQHFALHCLGSSNARIDEHIEALTAAAAAEANEPGVRAAAITLLGRSGADVADTLAAALEDEAATVRTAAARALTYFPQQLPRHVDTLERMLNNESAERAAAIAALQSSGDAGEATLRELLEHPREELRRAAFAGIRGMYHQRAPLGFFRETLERDDRPLQIAALEAIAETGPAASGLAPEILALLQSDDQALVDAAVATLLRLDAYQLDAEQTQIVLDSLARRAQQAPAPIAAMLRRSQTPIAEVIRSIATQLPDAGAGRAQLIAALASFGADAAPVAEVLIPLLDSDAASDVLHMLTAAGAAAAHVHVDLLGWAVKHARERGLWAEAIDALLAIDAAATVAVLAGTPEALDASLLDALHDYPAAAIALRDDLANGLRQVDDAGELLALLTAMDAHAAPLAEALRARMDDPDLHTDLMVAGQALVALQRPARPDDWRERLARAQPILRYAASNGERAVALETPNAWRAPAEHELPSGWTISCWINPVAHDEDAAERQRRFVVLDSDACTLLRTRGRGYYVEFVRRFPDEADRDPNRASLRLCGRMREVWHHVAIVHDRCSGDIRVHYDGQQRDSGEDHHMAIEGIDAQRLLIAAPPSTLGAVRLGANSAGERPWRGRLRDLRIYDLPLSAERIAQLAATE